ncbi:MAG: hypothetical protein GY805_36660 [Chloroflexi bacterium]|nr:hypothetical protein [Chloroflexota bacterium]
MNIGHYGVSLALKKADTKISLGLLFFAAQFVDILWAVLVLLGIERAKIVPGITAANPIDYVYYPFSHSLLASFLWAGAMYILFRMLPAKSGSQQSKVALVMSIAVLSHFFLDLLIHRPDLPLSVGDSPTIGLGLWNFVLASYIVEGLIFFGGLWLYMRATTGITFAGKYGMLIFAAFLFFTNLMNLFGTPPPNSQTLAAFSLTTYLIFIGIALWLDRKRI